MFACHSGSKIRDTSCHMIGLSFRKICENMQDTLYPDQKFSGAKYKIRRLSGAKCEIPLFFNIKQKTVWGIVLVECSDELLKGHHVNFLELIVFA